MIIPPSILLNLADSNGRKVGKLVNARSWLEYIKLLWGHNHLFQEVRGNRLLQQPGIPLGASQRFAARFNFSIRRFAFYEADGIVLSEAEQQRILELLMR